jgi:hypothetical protein
MLTGAFLLAGASSAWAGVNIGLTPDLPTNLTVGTTVPTEMTLRWNNSGGETGFPNRVDSLTLVPSCGDVINSEDCTVLDPGVLIPSTTGTGQGGACPGTAFSITPDPSPAGVAQGKYIFTWAGTIILTPTGATSECIINFTTDVKRIPTIDADGGIPGIQTSQKAGAAVRADNGAAGLPGGGQGTDIATVVAGSIVIQTQVAPNSIVLGATFHDTATITKTPPGVGPTPTGTVRFDVYGPSSPTCTGTPKFSSTNALSAGGIAVSNNFQPDAAGTWKVVATFLTGDTNYVSKSSLCDDPNEAVVVTTPATTPPAATPPPPPPPPPPAAAGQPGASTEVCTTPPGPAPAGGELCARGTAAIRGRTGCQGTPFRVSVSGRQIRTVVFYLDGRKVRTLTKPNRGSLFVMPVNPRTLSRGVHRVIARTTFRSQSGTRARTLRTTFSLCARRASSPAFTG